MVGDAVPPGLGTDGAAEVVSRFYPSAQTTSTGSLFDVSGALGAAFADVVVRGEEAGVQARALHAVLVDATSRQK